MGVRRRQDSLQVLERAAPKLAQYWCRVGIAPVRALPRLSSADGRHAVSNVGITRVYQSVARLPVRVGARRIHVRRVAKCKPKTEVADQGVGTGRVTSAL